MVRLILHYNGYIITHLDNIGSLTIEDIANYAISTLNINPVIYKGDIKIYPLTTPVKNIIPDYNDEIHLTIKNADAQPVPEPVPERMAQPVPESQPLWPMPAQPMPAQPMPERMPQPMPELPPAQPMPERMVQPMPEPPLEPEPELDGGGYKRRKYRSKSRKKVSRKKISRKKISRKKISRKKISRKKISRKKHSRKKHSRKKRSHSRK